MKRRCRRRIYIKGKKKSGVPGTGCLTPTSASINAPSARGQCGEPRLPRSSNTSICWLRWEARRLSGPHIFCTRPFGSASLVILYPLSLAESLEGRIHQSRLVKEDVATLSLDEPKSPVCQLLDPTLWHVFHSSKQNVKRTQATNLAAFIPKHQISVLTSCGSSPSAWPPPSLPLS